MPNQNLRRDEAATRSALITTHSYDVTLDVRQAADPDVAGYQSRSVINFSAARPGASTFLDFIGSDVASVVLNGTDLPAADVVDGARIRLDNLQAENQVTVTGTARYSTSGEGMHRFFDPADGQCYLYTQYEPADARRVFANFEQPDLKAEFTFHVLAPSAWQVSSNGTETRRAPLPDDPETSCWDFAPTRPMSTYITTVLAGPYFKAEDSWCGTLDDGTTLTVPLALYCRASMAPSFDTAALMGLTKNGLDFFNRLFDFPYPWGKYEQAFVPEYNLGAMENPGLVTFTESYVFTSRAADSQYQARANTLLHEMAHMWFGDLVTMQWWDDLWLKESFADYMGTLGVDRTTDWDTAWVNFANNRKAWAYVQDQLPTTHPIVADIPDLEAAKQNFDGITYAKGASVLRQLVAWVGPEQFMAGVREYFSKHAWRNTELSDLMVELEKASGRDLDQWGRLWLETAGVNTLKPELSVDGDGTISSFAILQTASEAQPTLRPHRLAVGFYNLNDAGKLERVHREELDVDGVRTDVPALAGRARPDLILLNDDDLAYAKVRLDPESLATATAHLKDFSQSLPRTLVWGSAWDAARDGETPARGYVELILANIAEESDSSVILVQLRQLATTLNFYVAAEHKEATAVAAADRLWQLASAVPAGSDAQLQFVKSYALLARSAGQLDTVAGLLDGSVTLAGLAVDQDLRWELLTSLVAGGRAGQEQIDAELEHDNTATGQNAAALAKAAIPTPEAKAAAWESIVVKGELSNALQGSAVSGFTRVLDSSLLEPYAAKYFDAVPGIVKERTHALAQQIVVGLYPAQLTTQATVDRTDEFLAALPEDSAALRRMMLENRDGVARALRARQADV